MSSWVERVRKAKYNSASAQALAHLVRQKERLGSRRPRKRSTKKAWSNGERVAGRERCYALLVILRCRKAAGA